MNRRGRGRSGRGDDERYSLEVEADDILSVAEALGGGIVVVAHFIAATITLQALRRADGLITGAVLYEPPLPGMESGLGSPQAMLAALEEGRDEDALVAFMTDMVRMPAEDIAAYQASPAWASRVSMIWTMRRETSALAALDPDLARYSMIPGPVRFLVGSRTASHQAEAVSALANVVERLPPPGELTITTLRSAKLPPRPPIDQESRSAGYRSPPSVTGMVSIESITLDVADPTAASRFYTAAFGLGSQLRLRASDTPTSGFRGFTLSLVVSQPATVDALIAPAVDAGATPLKPAAKSLWGYGGVVQAPDGTIWKIATSKKKDTGPATRQIDEIVLLLGAADVVASKRFYLDRGLAVGRSFGRKYVEFATSSSPVKLALYGRFALAKDAGVAPDGSGSHRLVIGSSAGPFTDPDGFAWEAAAL